MKHRISWGKVGAIAAGAVIVAGAAGSVALLGAQARRVQPQMELRALIGGGPELGVSIRELTEADARTAQIGAGSGVYVESVRDGSPASRAGILAADVITAFDGERVRSVAQLQRLVRETPDGRAVEVVLQRAGKRMTLSVTPAEPENVGPRALLAPRVQPDLLERFDFGGAPFILGGTGRLGVSTQTLTDQLREYFGAPNGVLVTSVQAGSTAAAAGLKAGDIITSVGGTTIRSVVELQRAVASAFGDVPISIWRDKKTLTLTAKFPARERERRSPANDPSI